MPSQDRQPLEAFVHRALRELPAERAPAGLEARVFAALEARHAPSWWQQGWRAWPVVPRTAVLVAAAAVACAVAWLFFTGTRTVETFAWTAWLDAHAPWLATVRSVAATLVDALALCVRQFQPWLLGLAAVVAAAYAALIALGSGLCRRLLINR